MHSLVIVKGGLLKCTYSEGDTNFPQLLTLTVFMIMSKNFALFLLENANNGNDILAVLDDIVEVTDTAL